MYSHPSIEGPAYRGRCLNNIDEGTKVIFSINDVVGIPGETCYGYYNIEKGELGKRGR